MGLSERKMAEWEAAGVVMYWWVAARLREGSTDAKGGTAQSNWPQTGIR